jgi:tetratricopeptide (TPR) repeat protein
MKTILTFAAILSVACPSLYAQDSYDAGVRALGIRDTSRAIIAFRKAVDERRKISESEYYLAAIAFARGNAEDASLHLDRSLADDDKNVNALKLQGDLLMLQNRVGDAIPHYRRGARLAPANVELGLALGRGLLAADSLDGAILQFSRVKMRAPQNPIIYEGLGDAYAKLGVNVMAIGNYREAAKLAPKSITVHMKLARLLLDDRKYNDAVKMLKSIHHIDSSYAQAYLEEAEVYCRAKMFRHAIVPLQEYRRLQPRSTKTDSLYVHALVVAGEHAKVAAVLAEILHSDSSSEENWRTYAHSLSEKKDYKEAIGAFAALERRDAMTAADECLLGKAYLQAGNDSGALASYERATIRDSLNCDPYYDLGFLHMKSHNYGRAAEMFERKIRCDSTSLGAYLNAGSCHLALADKSNDRSSQLTMARDLFTRARELSPENLTVRFRLAQCLVLADSQERAREEYEEVLRIAEKNPTRYKKEAGEAHLQIAMYFASKKQPDRAIVSFAKAEQCKLENSSMQVNWGLAILQVAATLPEEKDARVKAAEAVVRFRRAVQLDPGSASAHFWLGEGLLRLRVSGDNESVHTFTDEACQEFRKALAIDPHHEGALKEARLRGCK